MYRKKKVKTLSATLKNQKKDIIPVSPVEEQLEYILFSLIYNNKNFFISTTFLRFILLVLFFKSIFIFILINNLILKYLIKQIFIS